MSNDPNTERNEMIARYHRDLAEQKRKAEARVAYLCVALRFFGVEKVTAKFDGYGDDGSIEKAVFHPSLPGDLPFGLPDQIKGSWEPFMTSGWEINAGSFGTLTLDVATAKVLEEIEHRDEEM